MAWKEDMIEAGKTRLGQVLKERREVQAQVSELLAKLKVLEDEGKDIVATLKKFGAIARLPIQDEKNATVPVTSAVVKSVRTPGQRHYPFDMEASPVWEVLLKEDELESEKVFNLVKVYDQSIKDSTAKNYTGLYLQKLVEDGHFTAKKVGNKKYYTRVHIPKERSLDECVVADGELFPKREEAGYGQR